MSIDITANLSTQMTYSEGDVHEMATLADVNPSSPTKTSSRINLDMIDAPKLQSIKCETKFNNTLLSIISPFVYIGVPYNFCFPNRFQLCHRIHTSWFIKAYTLAILFVAHALLGFWIVRTAVSMIQEAKLTTELLLELFRLSYMLAGVVSLDIVWLNRSNIRDLLNEQQIDFCPLDGKEHYQNLQIKDRTYFQSYGYKTFVLKILSKLLAVLLVVFWLYLITAIVIAYTDSDPQGYDWNRVHDLVSIYSLYFFVSNAFFLIALIWTLKYKILHLNLYVTNLVALTAAPNIEDIEIIKDWYQSIKRSTKKADAIFSGSGFLPVYIGLLTWGIIYLCSKIIDKINTLKDVESVQFMILAGSVALIILVLYYSFKELTDVYEYSAQTKSILYDYVLNTKPEERSTLFFEEINFVINGLLTCPIKFTLFGYIDLTKSFTSHLVVVIYSYVIVFHQLSKHFTVPTIH